MYILEDLTTVCSDPILARTLDVVKTVLNIICIIAPIVLIVMVIVALVKLVFNPDEKKGLVKIFQKFIAALLIFFLPNFINLLVGFVQVGLNEDSSLFDFAVCWTNVEEAKEKVEDATYTSGAGTAAGSGGLMGDLSGLAEYVGDGKGSNSISGEGKGVDIVNGALKYVGGNYVWGGGHDGSRTMEEAIARSGGVDCSAFVRIIYLQYGGYDFGGDMIDVDFRNKGDAVSLEEAKAGDIVCYDGHVAIYDGNGMIVEAKGRLYGITHDRRADSRRIITIRRIFDD